MHEIVSKLFAVFVCIQDSLGMANNFDKIFKLRPTSRFGLATPEIDGLLQLTESFPAVKRKQLQLNEGILHC